MECIHGASCEDTSVTAPNETLMARPWVSLIHSKRALIHRNKEAYRDGDGDGEALLRLDVHAPGHACVRQHVHPRTLLLGRAAAHVP